MYPTQTNNIVNIKIGNRENEGTMMTNDDMFTSSKGQKYYTCDIKRECYERVLSAHVEGGLITWCSFIFLKVRHRLSRDNTYGSKRARLCMSKVQKPHLLLWMCMYITKDNVSSSQAASDTYFLGMDSPPLPPPKKQKHPIQKRERDESVQEIDEQ